MLSRRRFLTATGLAGASLGAPHIGRSALTLQEQPGARPERIIHIVSDGMSAGTLTCADALSQMIRGRGLSWMKLYQNPAARSGFMNMRSLNSLVTDSSAASSSWGSGSRIMNGAVNMLPDGRWLTPLYTLFADAGWARGLVTTTEITHATPAGFAANAWLRDNPLTIAGQYFERKVDVLLGGGASFFDPRRRRDRRNLAGEFQAAGYDVVQDRASLEAAPLGDRLLGVFAGGHLPFTIDHQQDEKLKARVPTLAEMTRAALAWLGRKNRFILQVEGGRVDHAAHNSDAATAFYEQIALDEAIEVCLAYQEENPETLLVLTTDHGNSNFGLNGTGQGYGQSSARLGFARQVKASFPIILDRLKKLGTRIEVPGAPGDRNDVVVEMKPPYVVEDPSTLPQDLQPEPEEPKEEKKSSPSKPSGLVTAYEVSPKIIADVIGEATGFSVSAQRAERFARYLAGENPPIYEQMNSETMQLGQLMANRLAVGFTGSAHTADYVPIVAIGPGAERFQGFIDNTQVFTNFTELAGIRFRNPTLPLISDNGSPSAHERIASYAEPPEEIA